jgi:hypothetical protein
VKNKLRIDRDLRIVASLALMGFLAGWAQAAAAGREVPNILSPLRLDVREGGIIRGDKETRKIALVFTGHRFAEGGEMILNELAKHQAKGAFFFTGEFYANTNFGTLIERIRNDGHYLGPHSDQLVAKEREDPHGLNGFILLLHIGSGPGRADKFHPHFGELLDYLAGKGYRFVRVDELLKTRPQIFLRANQLGYRPRDAKLALAFGKETLPGTFSVTEAPAQKVVFEGVAKSVAGSSGA